MEGNYNRYAFQILPFSQLVFDTQSHAKWALPTSTEKGEPSKQQRMLQAKLPSWHIGLIPMRARALVEAKTIQVNHFNHPQRVFHIHTARRAVEKTLVHARS
ncbi:hypothetical protein FRC03_011702 [Tulasnella sp. 419]|nr:hypothetical protein FRC03_011702 [Tulasnella sp. 419]